MLGAKAGAIAVFLGGAVLGAFLWSAYSKLETDYWRIPGKLYAEMPRLHAWAFRLMALGGPGRDGSIDFQVSQSEWEGRGGSLKKCFANGASDGVIRYEPDSETLSAVYRCTIGDMIGELEVGFNDWESNGEVQSSYQFRVLDAASAAPIEPRGVFGR